MPCARCEPLGLYVAAIVQLRGDWLCEACFGESLIEVRDMVDDLLDSIESRMAIQDDDVPRGTPVLRIDTLTPKCLN